MGTIAFSKKTEQSWGVAGWAIRQILDDVASQYPQDAEMLEEFEAAKAIDGFMIYLLRPELAARVTEAIREVANGIVSGTIRSGIVDKPYGDERTVQQYRGGLRQLLEIIPSSRGQHAPRLEGT